MRSCSRAPALLLGMALALLACVSRSPFSTHPSYFALEDPCRYMGTLHKESRLRLEDLRMCGVLSLGEWKCMARALRTIDEVFTARCTQREVSFEAIASEQRRRYAGCLEPARPATLECTILSTEARCLADQCS